MIYQVVEALLTAELLKSCQPLQAGADGAASLVPPRPNTPVPALQAPAHQASPAPPPGGPSSQSQLPQGVDPSRPVEVALGLLANLTSHDDLAARLAAPDHGLSLVDLVCGPALHTLSSSAALSELCRLASTALRKPVSAIMVFNTIPSTPSARPTASTLRLAIPS